MAFLKKLAELIGLATPTKAAENTARAEPQPAPAPVASAPAQPMQPTERVTLWEHNTEFAGRRVQLFQPDKPLANQTNQEINAVAWRLGGPHCANDDDLASVSESLTHLASDPDAAKVDAIVLGSWASWEGDETSDSITQLLVASHDKLPNLGHLFFADIVTEESEISWIEHTDVAPILAAYPKLGTLILRGSGIAFGRAGHSGLTELLVQSGGMMPEGVRDLSESDWPELERLELWLGTGEYGGGAGPDELARLMTGEGLPKVVHLGLKNSDRQDEIVEQLMTAPILGQLKTLDLSMGTLSDTGAKALLDNQQQLSHLERIILRWNYIGDDLTVRLRAWPNAQGVGEKADDMDEGEEWRFVEVSE